MLLFSGETVRGVAFQESKDDESQAMPIAFSPAFHTDPQIVWNVSEQIRHASASASLAAIKSRIFSDQPSMLCHRP
jgi:hypothetical protein